MDHNTYAVLLEVPEGMTPDEYVEAHRLSTCFIEYQEKRTANETDR